MLTREHAIAAYEAGRVVPDRLTRAAHAHYRAYAERMLRIYRSGVGRTRRALHRAVYAVFAVEPDCPLRRIEAFCKLLDDAADYDQDRRGQAAALRREVFRRAARLHPLVRRAEGLYEHEEAAAKQAIAAELGTDWGAIDRALFADVMEFQTLRRFEGFPNAAALLSRYNVGQLQVALYDAVEMTDRAREDFKTIVRYAKLAGLMHRLRHDPHGAGYALHLDGPASVLRETRRYGVAMAKFLPALLACGGWQMHAVVRTRRAGHLVRLQLSAGDGFTSHLPPPDEFDSSIEEAFARKWGAEKRHGWSLLREGAMLERGQKIFVPDFVLRHDDGRVVLLEIVGFWTPEYLAAKRATLAAFPDQPMLLAVPSGRDACAAAASCVTIPFKSSLKLSDVLAALEQFSHPVPCGDAKTRHPSNTALR